MKSFSDIGYVGYVVGLLIATGIVMLRFDVVAYAMSKQQTEEKAGRILGWGNIVAGSLLFIANWIYHKWFW